jgi:hypothetical protein
MSDTSQVEAYERDPKRPPGLLAVAIAAIVLGTFMYVLFPGHGPIQGHATAPAASANPG